MRRKCDDNQPAEVSVYKKQCLKKYFNHGVQGEGSGVLTFFYFLYIFFYSGDTSDEVIYI